MQSFSKQCFCASKKSIEHNSKCKTVNSTQNKFEFCFEKTKINLVYDLGKIKFFFYNFPFYKNKKFFLGLNKKYLDETMLLTFEKKTSKSLDIAISEIKNAEKDNLNKFYGK